MTQSLSDQTVVVLGGSAGIGLATARAATAEGANAILTGRDHRRLEEAAKEIGAAGHAAFDAKDVERLREFFWTLDEPVDHVLVSAGGPFYAPLKDLDTAAAGQYVADSVQLALEVAKLASTAVRPGGTLLFDGLDGLDARREQLRENLPIKRVVGPDDVAALVVHLMVNTALTGATFDVDGGQQII